MYQSHQNHHHLSQAQPHNLQHLSLLLLDNKTGKVGDNMATKNSEPVYIQGPPPQQQRVNEVGYLPPSADASISLKEYFDSVIQEKEKRYEQRFTAQQEAVLKAESATDKRFESVNEFRDTLKNQQDTFATKVEIATANDYIGKNIAKNQEDINDVRLKIPSLLTSTEYALRHTELQLQITAIRDTINTNQGKTIATDPVTDARFTGIAKTLEDLGTRISSLNDTRSVSTGASNQSSATIAWIFGAVGAGVSVILLILRLMGK